MKGATCPACGVAVLPGYARCPNKKCRKPLPRRAVTQVEGGTSVTEETKRWPLFAAIGAALVGTIVIIMLGRGGDEKRKTTQQVQPTQTDTTQPTTDDNRGPVLDTTAPTQTPTQPTGPDPGALAGALQADLKRQRLWSTVSIDGNRVEVRSGSCADPAMGPILDGASAGFKAAGLTKMRCVEQSGRVVTDRDL